ncbi:putative sugar nucleotidyl transferase, partial [Ralstonia sp.]|uniref:putative sugar nucleotidyl transferase n=1 Tax=Ralstonia sp. TaxID=54061 RepID=UPI001A575303
MNIVLFDDQDRSNLLPLTFTRPIADIRVGITTIREKWEATLESSSSSKTEGYLTNKFPLKLESENLLINGAVFPSDELVEAICLLDLGQALVHNDVLIAIVLDQKDANSFNPANNDWI